MTLQEAAWEVSIAVGSIAVLTFIYTKMLAPLVSYIKAVNLRDEKIDSILAQFSANGGATIKDQLNRIELAAITSNKAITLVASMLNIGTWKADTKGYCVEVSEELCEITGRSEQEILGNNWSQWIHPDDKERVWKAWQFFIENRTIFNERYHFVKDGKDNVYVHGTAHVIQRGNEIIGIFGLLKKENHVPKI